MTGEELVRRSRIKVGSKVWVGVKINPMIHCMCGHDVVFWFDKTKEACNRCRRVYEIKKDGTVVYLGFECSNFDCHKAVSVVFKVQEGYYCEDCARVYLGNADEWAERARGDLKRARETQRANRKMKLILDQEKKTRKKHRENAENF